MVKLYREKIAFRGSYRCKFKSAAELGPAQLVCFIRLELVRAPVTTFVSTFLANVLKQLLTTFSISISYTSHMLAKVLSKRKLICYGPRQPMMAPRHLLDEVFQAYPTKRRPRGRPNITWKL